MEPIERKQDNRDQPLYKTLLDEDRLKLKVTEAEAALFDCHLCGNDCHLDRTRKVGPCGIGNVAYVASYGPHHGEEDVLRGRHGSGTIFFSGCNLHCVYCQNADISQRRVGIPISNQDLAEIMLDLQNRRCHNINLVSPTHVVPMIVKSLAAAIPKGLTIPIVYNTGGYDSDQALDLMENLVDIYMPDMKYANATIGFQLSRVRDYPRANRQAVKTMYRQVGDLEVNNQGLAYRGLLVRHLVLPGKLANTKEIAQFLAKEISKDTAVNLMAQYRPAYRANECATDIFPLDQRISPKEYESAVQTARQAGLHRFL
jgi:putative pyruvate formate lyase activating enzyme